LEKFFFEVLNILIEGEDIYAATLQEVRMISKNDSERSHYYINVNKWNFTTH
jgi:hypothetical protein